MNVNYKNKMNDALLDVGHALIKYKEKHPAPLRGTLQGFDLVRDEMNKLSEAVSNSNNDSMKVQRQLATNAAAMLTRFLVELY